MQPDTAFAVHATAVAVEDRGILICGRSGTGKSRLAVALVATTTPARPIHHVGDDRILVEPGRAGYRLRPHPAIAGFIERRGLGIVAVPYRAAVQLRGICEFRNALRPEAATAGALALQNFSGARLVMEGDAQAALAAVLAWLDAMRVEAQEAHLSAKARALH